MPAIANAVACIECKEPICEVCNLCETSTCAFNGHKVVTAGEALKKRFLTAKSQKIRGYGVLSHIDGFGVPKPF
jgi:hypothetical protein